MATRKRRQVSLIMKALTAHSGGSWSDRCTHRHKPDSLPS